jgi:hypothetical protein
MNVYLIASASINSLTELSSNRLPEAVASLEGIRRAAIEPDYKSYIPDAGVRRRMSRVVKMGVAAATQCLSQTDRQPDAIIMATGLGCLSDTEKFLKCIIENNEQLLNPTPFIQSTFNTVGAQVAINLKNTNYNMTYVHRGFSFENALLDAMMKLQDREAEQVLVGSYEEITGTSFKIMERLAFWRRGEACGEGAQCFMLSAQPKDSGNIILKDVLCVLNEDKQQVKEKLLAFLQHNNTVPDDLDVLISGRNGEGPEYPWYQWVEGLFKTESVVTYKSASGDYPTVSSLALWLAMRLMTPQINSILIYNNYKGKNHSFVLIEKEI